MHPARTIRAAGGAPARLLGARRGAGAGSHPHAVAPVAGEPTVKVAATQRDRGRKVAPRGDQMRIAGKTGSPAGRAPHADTARPAAIRSPRTRVLVARPRSGFGSRGPLVRSFQRRLARLRCPATVSGVLYAATGRAVMAWGMVNSRTRAELADAALTVHNRIRPGDRIHVER